MRCKGTMCEVPNKLFARCDVCHRISYQMYDGDPCPCVLPGEGVRSFSDDIVWRLAETNPIIQATLMSYPNVSQRKQFVAIIEELAEENERPLKELADEKKNHPPTTFAVGGPSHITAPMMHAEVFDELLDKIKDLDNSVSVGVLSAEDEALLERAKDAKSIVSIANNVEEKNENRKSFEVC